ncbi:MAG: hypothetical protein L6366_08010 [Candidatus Omnitrophica bacterium]|nr:hypothetical protein [Candidatus Omnitrophota bacterium]
MRNKMRKEETKISCLTFQRQEAVIRNLTDKINAVKIAREKALFAEEIQKEVDVLLSCAGYKKESLDCKNCHFIANLRKKTTDIIINAEKLA